MQTQTDPSSQSDQPQAPAEAMRDALGKLGELRAYAQQCFSAKADLAKATGRNLALFAALGFVGLITASATLVIALVMFFSGLAGAIGSALGGRMWAGNLIVGFVLVALFAGGAVFALIALRKSWMRATVKKYELAEQQQRNAFGRSSRDRTAAQGSVEV
jgi:hypothetical protein